MAAGEFQDRELQSQDVYTPPASTGVINAQLPQGAAGQGVPQVPFKVQAVYDSRPILSKDWNTAFDLPVNAGYESANIWQALVSFPAGYVAVLKKFSIQVWDSGTNTPQPLIPFQPLFGVWKTTDVSQNLTITNSQNTALNVGYVGQVLDQEQFVIVPDGFQLYLQVNTAYAPFPGLTSFYRCELYGNLLLDTGIPATFAPGL